MIDDASRIDDGTIAIDPNSNKLDKQVLDLQCCVCHLVGVHTSYKGKTEHPGAYIPTRFASLPTLS
jgi:hypothetical protein